MSHDELVAETDTHRVRLVLDAHPDQPYDDGGSPVFRLLYRGAYGDWVAEQVTGITSYVAAPELVDAIAANRATDSEAVTALAEWGVTAVEGWHSGDCWYVTCDPADWRESVGAAEGSVSLDEWRAYCLGDAWGYVVEERATWRRVDDGAASDHDDLVTWEHVDSLWGLYGYKYAVEAARDAFAEYAPDSAQGVIV